MVRRVVTGRDDAGKPTIVHDGEPPRAHRYAHIPGMSNALIWTTRSPVAPSPDLTPSVERWVPAAGETLAMTVTFPPDKVFFDPGFDPATAATEQFATVPGLAELFEPDGMHTTPTIDYGVVLEGELVLDLGGESTVVRQGDVIVHNATRHAWRNPYDKSATVFFVLIGTGAPG
jgi:mannose-6-phosphate isomerase-like protein (cupin superfamily)